MLYADDIILLAQTTFAMQKMLDICMSEITALDLQGGPAKVGPTYIFDGNI